MKNMSILVLLGAALLLVNTDASYSKAITINPTGTAALLDGRCGNDDEWHAATKLELPHQAFVYLMHDDESFYICAKGEATDTAVLDLYIEHAETGYLHKFHLSAQMGERVFTDQGWSDPETWILKDWAGFWVPYFGNEDSENGKRPKFYTGLHRQVQVLRKKFPGNTWNMMFGVSIKRDGKWMDLRYPEKAEDEDKSTWATFAFSE
ncbi:hypothetical protein [Arenicella xantha]|uniref:Carbohydrate-binding domain-containing protein n=1 Tax=Arenicella xantha TaxID=644221 RepID=A0A395JIK0_9GAMM|nr:hypothetical protein [Arenicella xantha]RBP50606.1 hypothetical protein DFR28_10217 [Arenicella xantha]